MDAEHPFDAYRRTPGPLGFGMERLNDGRQLSPRKHIYLIRKPFMAGQLPILPKAGFRKVCCSMGAFSSVSVAFPGSASEAENKSDLP